MPVIDRSVKEARRRLMLNLGTANAVLQALAPHSLLTFGREGTLIYCGPSGPPVEVRLGPEWQPLGVPPHHQGLTQHQARGVAALIRWLQGEPPPEAAEWERWEGKGYLHAGTAAELRRLIPEGRHHG